MRILITGANAFVGIRLCDETQRLGWQVRGAVRSPFQLSQGVKPVAVGSTTELVRGLMRAANVSARLMPVPVGALRAGATLLGMEGEVQRHCGNLQVDISKARNDLAWHPPVPVDEALRGAVFGLQTS